MDMRAKLAIGRSRGPRASIKQNEIGKDISNRRRFSRTASSVAGKMTLPGFPGRFLNILNSLRLKTEADPTRPLVDESDRQMFLVLCEPVASRQSRLSTARVLRRYAPHGGKPPLELRLAEKRLFRDRRPDRRSC